jgi:hypothetical protein
MSINWKRGLRRLYFLITVLWILSAGGITYLEGHSEQQRACDLAKQEESAPAAGQLDLRAGILHSDYNRKICDSASPLRDALEIAFIPPILGYGLFCAGCWVASGFRRESRTE